MGGQPPDALHHRGHQVHGVGPVLLDQGQGALGIEAGEHHDVETGEQRGDAPHDRAVVVEGAGPHEAAVRRHAEHDAERELRLHARRVAREDQLRPARRTSGGRGLPGGTDAVGERAPVVEPVPGRRGRAAAGHSRVVGDHQLRVGQVEDGGQLALGHPRVQRLRDGPDRPARRRGHEPVDAVGQGDRHEVAEAHPCVVEHTGEAVGPVHELRPAERRCSGGDGRAVGIGGGELAQPFRERKQGHPAERTVQDISPRDGGRATFGDR